ncbi:MAG TPA: hypothetical protein VEX18_01175 [Polyangiaceae bacterium]|nr:hypothetical protein [Polyangiaceae bacterium]
MNFESVYTYAGTHEIHTLVLGRALPGEDAATWSAESAARWWSAHRTPFRAQCEAVRRRRLGAAGPALDQGATLQIDLERRVP